MQDPPQALSTFKETLNIVAKLKELQAANRDPWDKDVEFHRQRLRRLYLQLLLAFPYSPHAKKIDSRMWLDTSHSFISQYKERIAALDRIISSPPETRPPSRQRHGPVEYRKLAQRFRQFLAEEEKFWIAFVTRFVRLFALYEAKPSLANLGISIGEPEPESSTANTPTRSRFHLFPEEGEVTPPTQEQKPDRMFILSKALVCVGDIARYREQYNESGGRPRAGRETHDEPLPRRVGRGGRREPAPRPRNYSRAQDCYEQSRLLFPDSGNSSHQLAILASYQADMFNSLYHYYRALCVRNPYTGALDNMDKQMARYLETNYPVPKRQNPEEPLVPRIRVDNFKQAVVILHSLWRSDNADTQQFTVQAEELIVDLDALVSERILPSEIITKVVILATGSLWTHRMFASPRSKDHDTRVTLETLQLIHILDVFRTLIHISVSQLTEISNTPGDTSLDLAQYISAVLRRMLPALRICSKWLIQNIDSLSTTSGKSGPELSDATAKLWDSYKDFASLLLQVFPMEHLRPMHRPLEEDTDLSGFAPLKDSMVKANGDVGNGHSLGDAHPNQEQLMRIHDLLCDAKTIACLDGSPIRFSNKKFSLQLSDAIYEPSLETRPPMPIFPIPNLGFRARDEPDDDAVTVSTKPEDDPVNLAMSATLDITEDDDDMDERILYPKQPVTPGRGYSNGGFAAPSFATPTHNRTPSKTTALDLVNQVLGGTRITEAPATTPQPQLLFGATSPHSHSIWSTSHDQGIPSAPNLSPYPPASPPTQTWPPVFPATSPTSHHSPPAIAAFPQGIHPPFPKPGLASPPHFYPLAQTRQRSAYPEIPLGSEGHPQAYATYMQSRPWS